MSHQGQGPGTERKEIGFAACLEMGINVSKAAPQFTYWHADLNAGCGFNREVGCDGSPLVFLRLAAGRPGPVRALFCDTDADAIVALRGRVAEFDGLAGSAFCYCEDNAQTLARLSQWVAAAERPEKAFGSVLCDPNGWKGFPVDALDGFTARHPRIDLLLNLNVSFVRSAQGCRRKNPGRWDEAFGYVPMDVALELLPRFHKAQWFVRNPTSVSGHHFMTLYGFNNARKPRRFAGFYDLESEQGRRIVKGLRRIDPDQPDLFPGLD